jgi:membrane protease YdiL (CAAX protease family)
MASFGIFLISLTIVFAILSIPRLSRKAILKVPANAVVSENRNGIVILLGFFILAFIPSVIMSSLLSGDVFEKLYGPDFVASLKPDAEGDLKLAHRAIASIIANVIAFPIMLGAFLVLLRPTRVKSDLLQWRWMHRLAWWGWLILTPTCYLVFGVVDYLFRMTLGESAEAHPLTQFVPIATTLEWFLFAVQVVLIAPVTEEILFRGLIAPWIDRVTNADNTVSESLRARVVHIGAITLGFLLTQNEIVRGYNTDSISFLRALLPTLFAMVILGISESKKLRLIPHGPAILASANLFAAIHSNVWPSPVPLLILGVGLGSLRFLSGSIGAGIILHGAFNAVTVVYLVLGGNN